MTVWPDKSLGRVEGSPQAPAKIRSASNAWPTFVCCRVHLHKSTIGQVGGRRVIGSIAPRDGCWTFYCDESGASGMNLVDQQQPVYVAGGVLAPPEVSEGLAALVTESREKHRIAELKAAALLKRDGGDTVADEVIERAVALGCKPFFVISEKRHNIAQKIVDVLMDPDQNSEARWLSLYDDEGREGVANQLLRLPDNVLAAFAEAYREPSLDTWKSALERLGAVPSSV